MNKWFLGAAGFCLCLFVLAGCSGSVKSEGLVYKSVGAEEANAIIKANAHQIIDVRTPAEFSEGHIEKARNIDFLSADFKAQVARLDKEKPYLVYCKSGKRSASALETFKALGFSQVTVLDGGLNTWTAKGLPLVK
jgi:rhodanese-related sulfurtransferase